MRSGKFIAGVVLVLGLFGVLMSQGALARMQQAPASRVVIDLPDDYKPARLFTGFSNEAAGVSLIIVEMPGEAYEQLANGLTSEALAAKGITKAEAGKLDRVEPYLYMRGEQMSGQGPVAKFMVAFKKHGVTALVTANVQKASFEAGTVAIADIEHIFTTATIAATAPPARDVFSLSYLGPFQPAGKILGASRAYTLDGKFEPTKAGVKRALLLVAPSLDLRPVTDAEAQAKTLFMGLPGLKETQILDLRSIQVADVPAIEIIGRAVDKDEGGEVSLYQVLVLPPRGGYYRLLGQVPMDDAGKLMPELSKIAQTFRIVE